MDEDAKDSDGDHLAGPDIARWRDGNLGIDYAHRLEGSAAGPEVMVSALVHGNEVCGAVALDRFLREGPRPRRGALTAVFCNTEAYRVIEPERPAPLRCVDEDFNRLWSPAVLDGERDSVELRRAREIRPLIDRAELLLDLHSMQSPHPPVMLAGPLAKGRELAFRVGVPEVVVADAGHAAGARMRDYDAFADPESPQNALLVECGQHRDPRSAEVAHETLYRFLAAAGVVDAADVAPFLGPADPPPQRLIEVTHPVTVETDDFQFQRTFRGLEVIAEADTLLAHDGVKEVRTPYPDCVLVMPSRQPTRGGTAVRLGRYVI